MPQSVMLDCIMENTLIRNSNLEKIIQLYEPMLSLLLFEYVLLFGRSILLSI